MSEKAIYSLDTNVIMDWQARYYPGDVFPSLANFLDLLVEEGRLIAPEMVKEELEAVGTDAIRSWVKGRRKLFVPTEEILEYAVKISAGFPGLLDPKAKFEEADPYVIGLAQMRRCTILTQETSASQKHRPKRSHFIPDVCDALGLPCIDLLGLMRREKRSF